MSSAFLARRRLTRGRRSLFKRVSMSGIRSRPMTSTASRRRARAIFRTMTMGRGVRTFNIEKKFHDVDLDDTVIASGGAITASINLIPQGVTEITRVGRKATIRNINWRFKVTLPSSTTSGATSDVARVMMYLDKQANGAAATVTDILETADFQSFNNLANKSRFRILFDHNYDLVAPSGGGDGTTEDYGEFTVTDTMFRKVNIPIEFDSTAGAITEIRSNNIGVLLITAGGFGGFSSKIRLRYTDL